MTPIALTDLQLFMNKILPVINKLKNISNLQFVSKKERVQLSSNNINIQLKESSSVNKNNK